MNCKPGDLAIVRKISIGSIASGTSYFVGRRVEIDLRGAIFECLSMVMEEGEPHWVVTERECHYKAEGILCKGTPTLVPDAILWPIRDHGDDAQDESKAWLPPVPQKEAHESCVHAAAAMAG